MNGLRSRLGSVAILPASKKKKGICRKKEGGEARTGPKGGGGGRRRPACVRGVWRVMKKNEGGEHARQQPQNQTQTQDTAHQQEAKAAGGRKQKQEAAAVGAHQQEAEAAGGHKVQRGDRVELQAARLQAAGRGEHVRQADRLAVAWNTQAPTLQAPAAGLATHAEVWHPHTTFHPHTIHPQRTCSRICTITRRIDSLKMDPSWNMTPTMLKFSSPAQSR